MGKAILFTIKKGKPAQKLPGQAFATSRSAGTVLTNFSIIVSPITVSARKFADQEFDMFHIFRLLGWRDRASAVGTVA